MHHIPTELYYTEQHIWIESMGDNVFRAGITDFAQDGLGDVVFVEFPEKDRFYSREDECAVVESVKSTSDIYCPVSGTIVDINGQLEDSPELVNSDPYSEGWLFTIKIEDAAEVGALLGADAYQELTE